jgi:DNA-binding CsgD family transcriptional regulator
MRTKTRLAWTAQKPALTKHFSAVSDSLTEKEKETLQLLLHGHDAKSIASTLNLSVHTVNDRLRDARRKLGATSSRQAARLFAESQDLAPNFFVPYKFGMAGSAINVPQNEQSSGHAIRNHAFGWALGGMLMLSFIVAASFLLIDGVGETQSTIIGNTGIEDEAALVNNSDATSTNSATKWLALLDSKNWVQSWYRSGTLFRSQLSQDKWVTTIKPVRDPLGKVVSRTVGKVTNATSLPGAPMGEYRLIEFKTNFANKRGSIETVVLAREQANWKVVGYFVR